MELYRRFGGGGPDLDYSDEAARQMWIADIRVGLLSPAELRLDFPGWWLDRVLASVFRRPSSEEERAMHRGMLHGASLDRESGEGP